MRQFSEEELITGVINAQKMSVDAVEHPSHYNAGGIECIDAIRAALTEEEFVGFCKGNALKYIWRERHKGGKEDLRKAAVYLGWCNQDGASENQQHR